MPFTMICDRIAKDWPLELSVAASPGWMIGWLDAWRLNFVESSVEFQRIPWWLRYCGARNGVSLPGSFWLVVGCWNNIQIFQATELMDLSIKSSNLQNLCIFNLSGPSWLPPAFCPFLKLLNWFMAQVHPPYCFKVDSEALQGLMFFWVGEKYVSILAWILDEVWGGGLNITSFFTWKLALKPGKMIFSKPQLFLFGSIK